MADIKVLKDKLGNILNPHIPRYDRLTKYSTDEVKTGKKWIDGKDIYRKVINTGQLPNNIGMRIPHNIANMDNAISCYGWAYRSSDGVFLNLPNPTYDTTAISCYTDKKNININTYTDRSAFKTSYVTIEYTKK